MSTRRKRARFFMILRAGLVKLNNKWRLARTVCAEGWNRATLMSGGSHRLWNQLLHATLFRSTSLFRWSTDAARLSARLASNSAPSPSPVQKANKSYLCLLHVSVKEEDLFRTGRNCPVERSHGDSIPRKVSPVQVKVHPRVQGCRYYRRIIYANYLQRTRVSRKQDPNCQYVVISFGREPIDRVPA